jgi:hypothetical protein
LKLCIESGDLAIQSTDVDWTLVTRMSPGTRKLIPTAASSTRPPSGTTPAVELAGAAGPAVAAGPVEADPDDCGMDPFVTQP